MSRAAPPGAKAGKAAVATEEARPTGTNDAETAAKKIDTTDLVQYGRFLFEAGNLEEAQKQLVQAIKIDPSNRSAFHYLFLTLERKNAKSLPESSALPDQSRERTRVFLDHRIVLPRVVYDSLPLSEVLTSLSKETRRGNPQNVGVNFLLTKPDLANTTIRIVPPITDIRLADLLDVIVRVADRPISYAIHDYGVSFSDVSIPKIQLHSRSFNVDTNSFLHGIQRVLGRRGFPRGVVSGHPTLRHPTLRAVAFLQPDVREFFGTIGVNVAPPNQIYFNDREGILMVRATQKDHDIIAGAIAALSPPPQIRLKTYWHEISETEAMALGLARLWKTKIPLLGDLPIFGRFYRREKKAVPSAVTESQFQALIRAFKERPEPGRWLPPITLLSGRTAHLPFVVLKEVLKEEQPAERLEVEMTPFVSPDGFSVQMAVIATLTEIKSPDEPAHPAQFPKSLRALKTLSVGDGETIVLGLPGQAKMRVLFITPTIVDAAGNPVHTPANRPFDPDSIPTQP